MSNTVLEHFKTLCQIPHCSYESQEMKIHLVTEAKRYGFEVSVDSASNILATKSGAKVTLQSHYDMVCIGANFPLTLQEKEGWLSAENSTLGADNGIGMAMMLSLMQEGAEVDLLFTADEEVGLLGARGLELPLKTPYLLNLDSEEEGIVTIGCAGGVDIIATKKMPSVRKKLHVYTFEIKDLPGGHSGVDIDKNIPNAITLLFQKLCAQESYIIEVHGGERRNSIPKKAEIVFGVEVYEDIKGALYLGEKDIETLGESCSVIRLLGSFESGVRALNETLNIVESSINLALIESSKNEIRVQLSARSMDKRALLSLEQRTIAYFEKEDFGVETEGFYAPWKPEENSFSDMVLEESCALFPQAKYGAIHAGLECGIIKEKHPNILMASIGPNIMYPHSNREQVELASVEKVYTTLQNIVRNLHA